MTQEGLMQYGYTPSPHNTFPQVKLMAASIDVGSNGHLVGTDVVSGVSSDNPLYLPIIDRLRQSLNQAGLLSLGESSGARWQSEPR